MHWRPCRLLHHEITHIRHMTDIPLLIDIPGIPHLIDIPDIQHLTNITDTPGWIVDTWGGRGAHPGRWRLGRTTGEPRPAWTATTALLDYWTNGLMDYWTAGLLDYWTTGLLQYFHDLRFRMKENYMIFLILFHVFRFCLSYHTFDKTYQCTKCLFHKNSMPDLAL